MKVKITCCLKSEDFISVLELCYEAHFGVINHQKAQEYVQKCSRKALLFVLKEVLLLLRSKITD